jgi:hypothetical protein
MMTMRKIDIAAIEAARNGSGRAAAGEAEQQK